MIKLRPYQEKVKSEIFSAWNNEYKNVLLVLPTGMGKTKSFCSLVIDTLGTNGSVGLKTAIMVHRKELVQQICLTLAEEEIPHNIIAARKDIKGIIAAERRMFSRQFYNPHSQVSVISVDTLNARYDVYKEWCKGIQQWITDEAAHVLKENKWGRAISYFENARGLGVTATPERLDKKGLGSHVDGVFDTMVEGPPTRWGIDNGYLSKYKIAIPDSDYQKYLKSGSSNSDYSKKAMTEASRQSHIIGDVVENYIKFAKGKQAIIFASDIGTAKKMEQQFKDAGITAQELNGMTSDAQRLDGLLKFRDKETQVLINVDLFDEGLDVPGIECVIMARPTKSLSKYLQMCLDEKTEILTKRGWVFYHQMKEHDYCAAFDVRSEQIKWCKNEEVIIRERNENEKMFSIVSPHLDIRITSQHDVISKSRHSKTWVKKTIDETLKRKDMFHIPVAGFQDSKEVDLTDAELNFIGWFLSDGSRKTNHYSEVVTIYQCVNQKSRVEHIRKTLTDCNFKFSEHLSERKGDLSKYDGMLHFNIMKDRPVRNFKGWDNKRGWKELSPWLDKSIPAIYEKLSIRQFKILINAYFLGDGTKKIVENYTPRTTTITCGNNKEMADRFQSLCVRKGLRCNLSTEKRNHLGRKDIYMLHIKHVSHSSIPGLNTKDGSIANKKPYKRARFVKEETYTKEKVWCVKNELGSIITRRNGKVSILGNCGRGLRVAEGKPHLTLIDHVGNVMEHGLPCKIRSWTLDRIRKSREKLNFLRICSNIMCNSPYDRALTECPWCGEEAIKNKRAGEGDGRIPPKMVDGDLQLIDPETIRELEARAQLEDPGSVAKRVSNAVNGAAGLKAMKQQAERIETQKQLVQSIASWAGKMKTYYRYTDRMIHKKFYLYHGKTITEALGEPKKDMEDTMNNLNSGYF